MKRTFISMNYLAHAYLSFNHPQILIGNMISDFVKGSSQFGYTANVQKGIRLHRAIDAFTDNHASTKEARKFFQKDYRLYSGPIMDIIYDHFLANDASAFNELTLLKFTQEVYSTLATNTTSLPPVFIQVLTYMRSENWLYHYKDREGIRKSLRGLARRATYLSEGETAYRLLNDNYTTLQKHYSHFFPDVKNFAKEEMNKLLVAE
jgi:acyl carrier protein phosphodiesterase